MFKAPPAVMSGYRLAATRLSLGLIWAASVSAVAGYLFLLGYVKYFAAAERAAAMSVPRYYQMIVLLALALAGLILVLTGDDRVVAILDGLSPALSVGTLLYEHFSVIPHYEAMVRGVIGLEQLAYFGLLSVLFLWLNVRVLERDRT